MIKFFAESMLAMVLLILFSGQTARAESGRLDEYEVKAAYIYNFAKYVDWPVSSLPQGNTPLVFCMFGKSHLNQVMETFTDKQTRGRRIEVRQLLHIEALDSCNVLFVNANMKTYAPEFLLFAAPRAILTISDYKGFAAEGGMIEFVAVRDKIRFAINSRSVKKAQLRVSSQLLNLAITVIE